MTVTRNGRAPRGGTLALDLVHPSQAPEAVEAEKGLLGSVLFEPSRFADLVGLAAADFSSHALGVIFGAMQAVAREGGAVGVDAVGAVLARQGALEEVGGRAFVAELEARGGPADVGFLVRQIRAGGAERRAFDVMRRAIAEGYKPTSRSTAERLREVVQAVDAQARLAGNGESGGLVVVNGAQVEPKEWEWLWQDRLPRGALCFLSGRPEMGKSWVALTVAAALTRGRGLPGPDGRPLPARNPERVIYASAEDDVERTLVRRLRWMDGDPALVDFVRGRRAAKGETLPVTFDDAAALEELVAKVGARLLVLDPYSAFFGAGDMNAASDTRQRLALMHGLAERTGATVLVVRHFKKGSADHALARGQGSVDATAAARAELHVGNHGDARALVSAKASVTIKPPGLGYRIAPAPELGPQAARLEWLGVVDATADDLDPPVERDDEERAPREEARDFIRDLLGGGPVLASVAEHRAQAAGISEKTLQRAKKGLGVRSAKPKGVTNGSWWWCARGQEPPTKGAPAGEVAPLAAFDPSRCNQRGFEGGPVAAFDGGLAPFDDEPDEEAS